MEGAANEVDEPESIVNPYTPPTQKSKDKLEVNKIKMSAIGVLSI